MTAKVAGYTKADGSAPLGLTDLAALGESVEVDPATQARLNELFKMSGTDEIRAKYKLEVVFVERRSTQAPFGGILYVMTNGGAAHGGGDAAVYLCNTKLDSGKLCNTPLDLKWIGNCVGVCPGCRNAVDPKELTGQILAKLPFQHWATLVHRVFTILGGDADLRMGVLKGDLRVAAEQEQVAQKHGDKLNPLRVERQWIVYPLSNIIQDTAAGAGLYKRIRAFLSA